MEKLRLCVNDLQHYWLKLPRDEGLESYSCPMCGQVVYWSNASLNWVKPSTSAGKEIPGNKRIDNVK